MNKDKERILEYLEAASGTPRRNLPSSPLSVSGYQKSRVTHFQSDKSFSGRFWRVFNDCMSRGSIVTANQNQLIRQYGSPPASDAKNGGGTSDLEREVQKQKEFGMICRKRMERTQGYLKHCLQVAQDNDFLHLIVDYKPDDQTTRRRPSFDCDSQLPPSPTHLHPELVRLTHQAKLNGWLIHPHEIEMKEKVGQGSTANVYRGRWRGLEVAVKCMCPDVFLESDNGVAFFVQELETLARQRHPFVLQLIGACLHPPGHAWVVSEFLPMTLKEWLHGADRRRRKRVIPLPPVIQRITKALEISQAMQYLHEQIPKVIHRDLKPSNIFLDEAMHVKLADFGNARFLSDKEMALTGEIGTYVYMAPEVIRCEPYDEKSDVYSYAIILNELLTGEHPYIETDYCTAKIALEVAEGKVRPALVEDDGQMGEIIDLIRLAWDEDVSIRPSFVTTTSTLTKVHQKLLQVS